MAYLRAVAAGDERTACRMVAGPTVDAPGCEGISATAQSIARRATQAGVTFDAVVVSGAVSLAGNGASVGISLVMERRANGWSIGGAQFS